MSILLLEDLAIVPLLAMIAFLAPGGKTVTMADRAAGVAIGLSAVARLFRASQHKAVERLVLMAPKAASSPLSFTPPTCRLA